MSLSATLFMALKKGEQSCYQRQSGMFSSDVTSAGRPHVVLCSEGICVGLILKIYTKMRLAKAV
jgi:hypothetical protein